MRKMRDSLGDDRTAWRTVMVKANDQADAKIAAVLNDDQKKAFATLVEERKEAMKKRMEANGNGQ